MDRSKLVAITTGAIALVLSIAYLLLVQLLDFRGEMVPAPMDLGLVPVLLRGLLS
ncbi:MAG: glucose-inhibited division protein A [Kaiparowitsia implicata GSE-PSE-MK54-09C]|jgi:hypothetical protein|nr:glucose-inhibited division protein A [Kaiparowitsia implicata GSE-PSE-MK54-09C]